MMGFRYSVNMIWSSEDEGYIATIPELPHLSAFGESAGDAVREVERAAGAYLEALEDAGLPLPEPAAMRSFSGQFRVRIPVSLHSALVGWADREGVSLNTLVVGLLAEGLGVSGERFLSGRRG